MTPKLLLAVLNFERCVTGRNANFPGEHVKEVFQKKPTWRILLVGENAIPPETGDLEVMTFQSIDYKAL